jgi:two-component system osmolarity sensor histidine kinase EnvZ
MMPAKPVLNPSTAIHTQGFPDNEPSVLDDEEQALQPLEKAGLSLFWRTFFLLSLLLLGSILAWLQTLRAFEFEPRTLQMAQQLASQVNLSRAALIHADAIGRLSLLKTMKDEEGLRIIAREPTDTYLLSEDDSQHREIAGALLKKLGPRAILATTVNGKPGLWVGFDIDGDDYWLLADTTRFTQAGSKTWLIWLGMAAALSLAGAAAIARLINRPLKELSFAASRVRDGDFVASRLSERVPTSEIRQVNIGFNRMAQSLAKVEQDRAVMLAGISHDLRTPLARLRLETELSVSDVDARAHMAADIAQLDAIIDKFLDYARPEKAPLEPLLLADIVESSAYGFKNKGDVTLNVQIETGLRVLGDEVELGRIISNLLENARKYGKSPETGAARIHFAAIGREKWVLIKIRDHGPGVPEAQLANLTKPFYRGEAARTAANGAGLGLAIVEKTVQRMGGAFALTNSATGGLSAHIKLQRA